MIEIYPNLLVGGADAVEQALSSFDDLFIISAAKEPWHREALGYITNAAPKDSPEYLIAHRPNRLILNLIDGFDKRYIPDEIIAAAMTAIEANIGERKVLVHCNQGKSRSPTLALMYLHRINETHGTFDEAVEAFKLIYPDYAPMRGIAEYAADHW